ncbi:MAG: hypothetical protein WBB93_01485, partial [Saprospiraceae bacterium]
MSITILGIALFLFSIQGMGKDSPLSKFSGIGKGVGILLIVAGLLSSMVVQIDAGKVGVQSLFGKVQ